MEDEDFAALFEASTKTKRLEPGRAVDGVIVAIGQEFAFVDVGTKGEASIAIDELHNDEGVLAFKVGDRVQATVSSVNANGVMLSRKLQRGAASMRQIEDACRAGLPVEGKVDAPVKGGYSVTIARQRAFCPQSQIDIARDVDPASHIGRVYTFRITEFKDDGRKFVVSRRALQEDAQRVKAEELRKTLEPGSVVRGRVVSVRDFGAFVDLGAGVQGLLHVSEMGWSRAATPSEIVKVDDEIAVKVLRVGADGDDKISLSMKQLMDDPWSAVSVNFPVGRVVEGRVTRLAEFGAFVELAPGVEGLAHSSTFPPTGRPTGWQRSVGIGHTAMFEVLTLDLDKKRIGVAIVPDGASRSAVTSSAQAAADERADLRDYAARTGDAVQSSGFGSLADKLKGALNKSAFQK